MPMPEVLTTAAACVDRRRCACPSTPPAGTGARGSASGRSSAGRMSTVARGFAAALADVELEDGWVELELAVGAERSFHGIVWRAADDRNYESFFVRPHQVGNPDAVQYTPVTNGISSWQLYHGDGFWAPLDVPGRRLVSDPRRLRRRARRGARRRPLDGCARLPAQGAARGAAGSACSSAGPTCTSASSRSARTSEVDPAPPPAPAAARWSAPRVGDLRRVRGREARGGARRAPLVDAGRERAGRPGRPRARARHRGRQEHRPRADDHPGAAARATKALQLGFSDRALVYLNGAPLYRGDATYRSRDYRFLGSIGWHDTLYLPLEKATTSSWSPCPRTSAAGGCRRGS